jgi:hypothetical protein
VETVCGGEVVGRTPKELEPAADCGVGMSGIGSQVVRAELVDDKGDVVSKIDTGAFRFGHIGAGIAALVVLTVLWYFHLARR